MTTPIAPILPRRTTLFEQVSESVSELIRQGRWKPGEMLPNEVELAALFAVSQGTVRRALGILVEKGVLIRHQGRGTFVADLSSREDIVYNRYIRLLPDEPGRDDASPTERRLVCFETVPAPLEVARDLLIPTGSPVIHSTRLLSASSGPVTYDELWANASDFRKLTRENLEHHEERMLYAFYQKTCGVTITRSEERIKAVLMPEALCREFGLEPPLPVIEVRRTAFTYGDRPVERHVQLSITERYHYCATAQ